MAKVSLRAYNREIEAMIDRGQLDEAIAHCHHILKTFPKHLETYRLLGKAYLEYKRYNEAVDIFSRVLAAEPNDFVSNVGMSIIRDEQNKMDDAIWHMERAFETQPSNPAIQSELQRLYGRRDGIQPPRIRMTRGALAHMYVQGELYPQAISEIKSVLKEDPGRSDMSVLLARAYHRSGQKNQAADEAAAVLRRYPYCLDANRVLVEIAGADRPESVQMYRQRVIELDPYAAQVTGSIFQSSEVGDNAVGLEHLDWNGKPVAMQSDWGTTKAIAPETGFGRSPQESPQETQAEPDWLKMGLTDSSASTAQSTVVPPVSDSSSHFDLGAPGEPAQPTPEEDLPEFLRAAGWGKSSGEFDESKSMFGEEPEATSPPAVPLEQGDLPDWVKAMAPPPAAEPAQPVEEEELPDWIQNIGTGALSSAAPISSDDQPDWMKGPEEEEPAQPVTSDEQPDWMKGFEQQPASSDSFASDDSMDWLKGPDQPETSQPEPAEQLDWLKPDQQSEISQPAASDDSMDWLKGLDQPEKPSSADTTAMWLKGLEEREPAQPAAANEPPDWTQTVDESIPQQPEQSEEPDWLRGLGTEPESAPESTPIEQPDWLTQFGSQPEESTTTASVENEFDFLDEISEKPVEPSMPAPAPVDASSLGKSEQERDDSFAWLEALAAKQGASEGLLTKPEERLEEEPEWVKTAKGTVQPPVQEPPEQPAAKTENLGKSQQEIDDSLAWLENLAAKQGATEGLLTRPEDRLEQEPEWVKQAKSVPQPPVVQPTASADEFGKSQQEIDDSLAWLENLAAKQGASEGLLTEPGERLEEEPEWVKQAKSVPQVPESATSAATAKVEDLGKSEQERDDSFAWLENLAAKQGATEGLLTKPEDRLEQEPEWVQQAKAAPQQPVEPEPVIEEPISAADDTTSWLRSLEQEEIEPEPESSKDETAMWFRKLEEPVEQTPAPQPEAADDIPSWLKGLEQEESVPEVTPAADTTAMWLQGLDEPEPASTAPEEIQAETDVPAWLKGIEEEEQAPVAETVVPEASSEALEAPGEFDWLNEIEEEPAAAPTPAAEAEEEDLPGWLKGVDEETHLPATGALRELPGWMRDETGEVVAEPTEIKPTRATDWQPVEEKQPEPTTPEPQAAPVATIEPVEELPKPKPAPRKPKPATEPKPEPYKEPLTTRGPGMLTMPVDPMLGSARNELSRSNIPGALQAYEKLIKKGRFLDEVIFDLREALYRYPVEVSIWQALGDAYMRANRLQDALDAYTKAEELLR